MFVYELFGSTALPQYDPNFDASPHGRQNLILATAGGQFDAGGADLWPVVGTVLSWRGVIVADDRADLQSQVRALYAINGTREKLYRRWHADDQQEWAYARAQVRLARDGKTESPLTQAVVLSFVVLSPCWYGNNHYSTVSVNGSLTTTLSNDGNAAVRNVAIIVISFSTAITNVLISCNDAEFEYSGTLPSFLPLIIDCGALSIEKNGADAYDDFELTNNHTAESWLPLMPGNNSITITLTGGTPYTMVSFTYYDGWH